ncbi:hypothetical protein [Endozoicomonas ascidiicola]|uniref:hypothetical protein n=1 Tax=Endozoicomonas ascidiicola TaxID=1698521 RepID=UPI0012FC5E5C|nr:hypothetical protein [Endozoicomonas ascidiicola]
MKKQFHKVANMFTQENEVNSEQKWYEDFIQLCIEGSAKYYCNLIDLFDNKTGRRTVFEPKDLQQQDCAELLNNLLLTLRNEAQQMNFSFIPIYEKNSVLMVAPRLFRTKRSITHSLFFASPFQTLLTMKSYPFKS